MKGSPLHQARAVFSVIDAIGTSKHAAKEQAIANGAVTKHDIAQQTGIHSYNTREQYINVATELLKYARDEFQIRDAAKLNNEIVNSFLQTKIAQGVARTTLDKYAAAIEKFVTGLNKFQQEHNLPTVSIDISESRQMAQEMLERTTQSRAYSDPQKLIENIKDNTFRTIAEAQLSGGFRISELNHMSLANFLGDRTFKVISGKGGLDREIQLPQDVYNKLLELANKPNLPNGKFAFDMNQYRNELKLSAQASNQSYSGSHGLRWNFAQNKYLEYSQKYGEVRALQMVSNLLGHSRSDITKHYLK
jgi:site-specific recombinase XerD